MAKRDFAHVEQPAENKPGRERTSAVMIGFSLLFTAILAFAGGYMVADTQHSQPARQAEIDALQTQVAGLQRHNADLQKQLADNAAKQQAAAKQAAGHVGDLTFYSALPKQKVMPAPLGDTGPPAKQKHHGENIDAYADLPPPGSPPRPARPAVAPKPAAQPAGPAALGETSGSPTAIYHLQLASYAQRSDAEALLARMQQAGIKGSIAEAKVAGVGTRFRVLAGPYTGMAETEGGRSLIREKLGINPMLRRD